MAEMGEECIQFRRLYVYVHSLKTKLSLHVAE